MSDLVHGSPVDARPPSPPSEPRASSTRLISASAVMMAGTLVSRVVGFGRLLLLAFLFGVGTRQADMFTVANAVPTIMYILIVGGVLNTVLVPQIVRAIKNDADGGEAYTNRIMTGGLIVLFVVTLALTLAVPAIISLYTASGWKDPSIAAQYPSMVALAYYCMPQIFFYGVYVLAGQVLNARDRFGPMMWSPIANNVISIVVLLVFLGRLRPDRHQRRLHPRPGGPARPRLDAGDRGPGGDPGAVPAVGRLPLRAPVRLQGHRTRQDRPAGQVDPRLRR